MEAVHQGAIAALRSVSFEVRTGEIHALLGANGAGKSTTLKAVSHLLPAERGQITVGGIAYGGQDVAHASPAALVRAGLVPVLEGQHCFPSLSKDHLVTGGLGRSARCSEIAQDLERIYALFPRLLVLDEASMGLAPHVVQKIFAQLCRLNREEGLTLLVAEQNSAVALQYACWMRGGVVRTGGCAA